MATCKHKIGLLSLRGCGATAEGHCHRCNIPICSEHTQYTDQERLCLECYADTVRDPTHADDNMDHVYERRAYYRQWGYTPLWYHHHYNDFDQAANRAATSAESMGMDDDMIAASDFQDS